jgi:uncharacterized protein YkwD
LRSVIVTPSNSVVRVLLAALSILLAIAPHGAADVNSQELQIFNYLKNAGGQGRPFAVLDPTLCRVARQKAADMANRGYYSHTNPDGHGPNWLVRQAGYILPDHYDQSPTGNNVESVNAGRASAGDAWSSWLDSSGHRVHLLGENSFYAEQTSVGVGFVDDPGSQWRYYWVVITAPPVGPTISIKTPKAGQEFTGGSVSVTGVTNGKPAAARVEVRLENSAGTGEWLAATGTTAWSIDLEALQPGSNTIRVRSLDATDAVLDQASRNVRYVVLAPLTVQINGRGTVTDGFVGNSNREVGRSYRINAKPAPGALFAGWTGGVTSSQSETEFIMSEGLVLTANFIENPFIEARGTYAGISTTSMGTQALASLKLNDKGRFTCKFKLANGAVSIRGSFNALGRAQAIKIVRGETITIDLTYSVTDGVATITGTIAGTDWEIPVDLNAVGQPLDSSRIGLYTVVIRANPDAPDGTPEGDGFASAKVTASGTTKLTGQLADGTPFSASGHMTQTGEVPVLTALYKKRGAFAGKLNFHPTSDIDGQFHWSRPVDYSSKRFPFGFAVNTTAVGGRYTPPQNGEPVVRVAASSNNAELELGAGGLSDPVLQPATLAADNSVIVTSPTVSGFSLSIKSSTGQFNGSFIHPVTGNTTAFRGVVVQKENAGFGYFVAGESSGYATLAPATLE